MIDVNGLVADFDTSRLLTLLGHYVCFLKKKKEKKKKEKNKKRKSNKKKTKKNDDNYQKKNYCCILFEFLCFFQMTLLGHILGYIYS